MSVSGTDKALMQELLCVADTDWVLGHWYIKVMLNGRSLPDCTAFAGMGQDSLGHTRAIFRLLEDRLQLPEHQLEFGRQPEALHDLEALSRPPQNWGDFLMTAFLTECAVWRLFSTFLDGADKELAGMVKHFGKELYFHRLGLEGWMLAASDEECADMKQSLSERGAEVARWFGAEDAPDVLLESGVRTTSVADARAGFLEDAVSVITQATNLSQAEVLGYLPCETPKDWDTAKRKTPGATVPATLWEFMIPTDPDTVALRRPLAVSVDDNLDLVDRSEYAHADYA
jgi:1,2-phenylacetyl-CoA epoxidase catalytic subunit